MWWMLRRRRSILGPRPRASWTGGWITPRRASPATCSTDAIHGGGQMAKRLTSADFDPRVLGLFDRYVHGLIDRREFLRATGTIVGTSAAAGVLASLAPQFAAAEQVKPSD